MSLDYIQYGKMTLIPPTYDRVFKALFVDDDLSPLASFMSSVLDIDIKADMITILNPEMPITHTGDKQIRLDVRVKLADGRIINVEMQANDDSNMGKRSIHSLSRIMSSQYKRGKKSEAICPVIAINVLDFNYIKDGKGYHNRYRLKNLVTNAEMPDAEVFEIHFLELPKLPKNAGKSMLELWIMFLSAKTKEELDMLVRQKPVFKKVVNKLVKINSSEERRYLEDMRIKTQLERESFARKLKTEGRAEGIDVMIKALKTLGMDKSQIDKAVQMAMSKA